jgi:hypothetical protein
MAHLAHARTTRPIIIACFILDPDGYNIEAMINQPLDKA